MEVRVALDTNRLSDLFRGDFALGTWLNTCDEVWVPLVVLGEIKAGFRGGTQRARNETLLTQLLAKPAVKVLLPSLRTAEYYAQLYVRLKRAGTPIPDNDVWIAASALEHNLVLVTRDKHFNYIPELTVRQ